MEGDALVSPKNKGGRPRKRGPDGLTIERPAVRVPVQAHPNVINTQYKDAQGRLSTPWVEIGDRIVGVGMTNIDWLAFLRLVKGLRRCEGLQCRGEGGLFQSRVAPIDMAAKLLDINLRSAREVHAQFQKTKELPQGSNRGNYEKILDVDAKFGHRTMLCWVRLICVQYAARDERLAYRCKIEEVKAKVAREWGERATEAVLGSITVKKMSTWCKNNGYRTVDLRGKKTIGESAEQNAKCAKFCRLMQSSLANPRKLQVYQDESYVNEKHARNRSHQELFLVIQRRAAGIVLQMLSHLHKLLNNNHRILYHTRIDDYHFYRTSTPNNPKNQKTSGDNSGTCL